MARCWPVASVGLVCPAPKPHRRDNDGRMQRIGGAMLAAQHAPIGAKICTIRAIRTIGKIRSRRRINVPTFNIAN
jgi:hypothetical protein